MSYICLDCGHIFEDGEQATYKENCGDFWGNTVYKSYSCCPLCGGEYEESTPCAICGSEQLEENLNGSICDECIDRYKHDIDMCFRIGKSDTDKVELNCFLAAMFEKEEIEDLLFEKLKERSREMRLYIQSNCERFVNSDRSWFAERLLEELEKEKR
jgi:hypothetical protein